MTVLLFTLAQVPTAKLFFQFRNKSISNASLFFWLLGACLNISVRALLKSKWILKMDGAKPATAARLKANNTVFDAANARS